MATTVCITLGDDGQITVGSMPAMEGMEGQPVGSIDEALQAAKEMLGGGAQTPEQAKESRMAGYAKAGNRPMMGGM